MTKLLDLPNEMLLGKRAFGIWDDFTEYTDTGRWTKTDGDTGASVALNASGVGGVLQLTTGATDNNEAYVESTNELFKFAADKPLIFEARVQYGEAATNAANVLVGLMDAPGVNSLLDDGAGPKATYDGAVFYKEDGQTLWSVESSNGAGQVTTQLTAVDSLDKAAKTAGSANYQTLRIEVQPLTSSDSEVRFFIEGVHVAKHALSLSGLAEIAVVVGVKAGGANSEVVNVDYIGCYQLR